MRHSRAHAFCRRPRWLAVPFMLAMTLVMTACASGGLGDKALEMVGLKKIDATDSAGAAGGGGAGGGAGGGSGATLPSGELTTLNGQIPKFGGQRQVAVRIHAGQVLNTDTSGRSLAVIVRLYALRGTSQFAQATYAAIAAGTPDRPFTNPDVVSSKEIVLVPGQKYEMLEGLPAEASHLAVVALFRSPDPQRWRFVFDSRAAARTGITVGVHGCALSVAVGEPVDAHVDALRLAGVQCR